MGWSRDDRRLNHIIRSGGTPNADSLKRTLCVHDVISLGVRLVVDPFSGATSLT
jgi:hypothetical protein